MGDLHRGRGLTERFEVDAAGLSLIQLWIKNSKVLEAGKGSMVETSVAYGSMVWFLERMLPWWDRPSYTEGNAGCCQVISAAVISRMDRLSTRKENWPSAGWHLHPLSPAFLLSNRAVVPTPLPASSSGMEMGMPWYQKGAVTPPEFHVSPWEKDLENILIL